MQKCAVHMNCRKDNVIPYTVDNELKFVKCNDCGIIWRAGESMEISKPYEEDYFLSKDYGKRRRHKVKKSGWLNDLARLHHPELRSMLEVGCSIGNTLEAAKIRDIEHLGIDISRFAVDHCNSLGLNARNADFDQLISEGQKYDLIFKQHVLEHFQDPFAVLSDCRKLLNENGLIMIMVPNSEYRRAVKKREKHRFYSLSGVGAEHYVYFNYDNLQKVLEASGFEVLQKNYPVLACKYFSLEFFMNRLVRRVLSFLNSDQEILVIARKKSNFATVA